MIVILFSTYIVRIQKINLIFLQNIWREMSVEKENFGLRILFVFKNKSICHFQIVVFVAKVYLYLKIFNGFFFI